MTFYIEFTMLAILLIGFTAIVAIVVNAVATLFFNKERMKFKDHLQHSQKNWRVLSKE